MADFDTDAALDNNVNAHREAAATGHTHSYTYVCARCNLHAHFDADCNTIYAAVTHAHFYVDRHADEHSDADFDVHANSDADGHAHANGHTHAYVNGHGDAHADQHAVALHWLHPGGRTKHRSTQRRFCRDSVRQLH
jgi:hypothetical protein